MCRKESVEVKFEPVLGYNSGEREIATNVNGSCAERVAKFAINNVCNMCNKCVSTGCSPKHEIRTPRGRVSRLFRQKSVHIVGSEAGLKNCRLIESPTSVPLKNMNGTQVADPHPNIGDRKLKI